MSKKIDILKAEIAETKAQLATKLTQLEGQVRHDASTAKESLDGAVDNVKMAVDNVKNAAKVFSISHQIKRRPLLVTGGAVVSGLVFVRWIAGPSSRASGSYAAGPITAPSAITGGAVRALKSVAFSLLVDLAISKIKAKVEDR